MKIITYQIELEEPVLVTALAGDPNTASSFDYLPGSVLRGAIIGAYLRKNSLADLADADPTSQRLFPNGQTQYLNGYLKDREDQRSLPSPFSWQQEKKEQQKETEENPIPALDFAYEEPADKDDPEKQWKGVKKRFFSFTKVSGKIRWLSADKVLAVHTQRDPVKGRSTSDQGAVYQYEALAAGQTFIAHIVCHADGDESIVKELLAGIHQIGGSRGAGYGRVKISRIDTTATREIRGELKMECNGRFLITCLSDLLLQDGYGQFQADPSLVKAALEKWLGCTLNWFDGDKPNAFVNGTYLGGFNRKWGLPLPQAKAISMGSVFLFEPPTDVTVADLQKIEEKGLGLRRAEGFGRIAFNWQTEDKWQVERPVPSQPPSPIPVEISSPEGQLLQTMVNRLFRQQLDAQVAAKANEWARKLPVQNSQLSRLRQVVQDELQKRPLTDSDLANTAIKNGQKRLLNYCQNLQKRNTTRKQFDKARINNKPLLDWFEAQVNDKSDKSAEDNESWIEKLLSLASKPAIGETTGQWTAVMRYEYNLRLIDLTLAYCLKKGKEGNSDE